MACFVADRCHTPPGIVTQRSAPRRWRLALGRIFRLVDLGEPRTGRGQYGHGGLEIGLIHPLDSGPQVRGRLVLVAQAELVSADQATEMRKQPVESRIQAGRVVVHRLEQLDGGLRVGPVGQRVGERAGEAVG
jgi:hypothetical protein